MQNKCSKIPLTICDLLTEVAKCVKVETHALTNTHVARTHTCGLSKNNFLELHFWESNRGIFLWNVHKLNFHTWLTAHVHAYARFTFSEEVKLWARRIHYHGVCMDGTETEGAVRLAKFECV